MSTRSKHHTIRETKLNDTKRVTKIGMTGATQQNEQFKDSLALNAVHYGVKLTADSISRLAEYYQLLNIWNPRLHLVAPCSADEFAQRHILESLMLLTHLPQGASVVDIGSGAGLPIIPCLIARPDLAAVLIESATKKAVFLREVLSLIETSGRASVIADRFENVDPPDVGFITARALDRFTEILPRLIEWSPRPSTLLLYGGHDLSHSLTTQPVRFEQIRIPKSERRFLYVVERERLII